MYHKPMEFPTRPVLTLTLLGLALRLWFNLIQHPLGNFLFSDMGVYNVRALNLLRGTLEPIDSFTAVGYPAFVALIYAVTGGSTAAVGLLHAVMGAATAWLAARISWKLAPSRAAATATCALTVGYLPLLSFGGLLMTETLCSFLGTLGVLLLIRARETPTVARFAGAGIAWAAAVAVRPYLVLLYPLLPLYFWSAGRNSSQPAFRGALRASAVIVAVSLPVFAATAFHNSRLVGRFNAFGTNGGLNFFLAHSEYRTVEFRKNGKVEYSITPIPNSNRYRKVFLSPAPHYEENFFYQKGLELLAEKPLRLIRDLRNVAEGLGLGEMGYWPGWEKSDWLLHPFNRAFFWVIALPGFGLLGVLTIRGRLFTPTEADRLLIGLVWAVVLATLYLFLGDPRIRVPFDPVFAALAANAFLHIFVGLRVGLRARAAPSDR